MPLLRAWRLAARRMASHAEMISEAKAIEPKDLVKASLTEVVTGELVYLRGASTARAGAQASFVGSLPDGREAAWAYLVRSTEPSCAASDSLL